MLTYSTMRSAARLSLMAVNADAKRNPPWARDELILALDLYLRLDRRLPNPTDPDAVALSAMLNTWPMRRPQTTVGSRPYCTARPYENCLTQGEINYD